MRMTDGLDVYGGSLALLTDLYQLTMACGYWKAGVADREAVFHLTFRRAPFGGAYAIAAGIAPALAYLQKLRFTADDVEYLAELRDAANAPLFPPGFLEYLGALRFCLRRRCSAGRRGRVSRTSRLHGACAGRSRKRAAGRDRAAHDHQLRDPDRDQGRAGAPGGRAARRSSNSACAGRRASMAGSPGSRAAYIGGVSGDLERARGHAFRNPGARHARAQLGHVPRQRAGGVSRVHAGCAAGKLHLLLVDTYDTIEGVRHAIAAGEELRARGHALGGIRLDSGDLAHLSIAARRMLDAAGFPDAKIVASNDLDETLIGAIIDQGARIDVWGVGTKLVTAYDQPALGGIYKLGASRDAAGHWRDAIKLSEQPIKISNPGMLGVRRLREGGALVGDAIYDVQRGLAEPIAIHDIEHPELPAETPRFDAAEDLLQPALDRGASVGAPGTLAQARARAASDLAALSPRTKRFLNPQPYVVGLDRHVHVRKLELIAAARSRT